MASASGALWWPSGRALIVSDMHLGKSERRARGGGGLLPPYETLDTLMRLDSAVQKYAPARVICLGDSFDDIESSRALSRGDHDLLTRLMAGREWIWIEGNHDPGPVGFGGSHLAEYLSGNLTFRHIAQPGALPDARGEISGHYHPKARLSARGSRLSCPCFLFDEHRLIMPAFGTYTGGLAWDAAPLTGLFPASAFAITTGRQAMRIPAPPCATDRPRADTRLRRPVLRG